MTATRFKGSGDTMTSTVPTPRTTVLPTSTEPTTLEAPRDLIEEYLEITAERRALEERLAYVRAELELVAAAALSDGAPRGRFVCDRGAVSARLQPTCMFDKPLVARELQRAGRLADVAILQGPSLARFLAKEPHLAARFAGLVRHRKNIVLMAGTF